jgi:hypothetical protein
MCHDIEETVKQLKAKDVEFVSPIEDEGWGRIARFELPGAGEIGIYQPQHPSPLPEFGAAAEELGGRSRRRRRANALPVSRKGHSVGWGV